MSETDNEAGTLWDNVLAAELEATNFGVVCLTPTNLQSRWINFEAGALSKAVGRSRVVPLLYRLDEADVGPPLSRFQMKLLNEDGIYDILTSMNTVLDEEVRIEKSDLRRIFTRLWPDLEAQLDSLSAGPSPRERNERELLEEVLELIRSLSRAPSYMGPSGPGGEEMSPTRGLIDNLVSIAGPDGSVTITGANQERVIRFRSPHVLNRPDRIALEASEQALRRHGIGFITQAPYRGEPE